MIYSVDDLLLLLLYNTTDNNSTYIDRDLPDTRTHLQHHEVTAAEGRERIYIRVSKVSSGSLEDLSLFHETGKQERNITQLSQQLKHIVSITLSSIDCLWDE